MSGKLQQIIPFVSVCIIVSCLFISRKKINEEFKGNVKSNVIILMVFIVLILIIVNCISIFMIK